MQNKGSGKGSNEDLKKALEEVLDARAPVDKETHIKHHKFIDVLIEEWEKKKERNEKIKTQVMGWGVILLLGAIGKAVYHYFVNHGG